MVSSWVVGPVGSDTQSGASARGGEGPLGPCVKRPDLVIGPLDQIGVVS